MISKFLLGGDHIDTNRRLINTFGESPLIRADNQFQSLTKGRIEIGNNVIGSSDSLILSGSIIGDNTLIAANSLAIGRYEENSVIGGNPAKVIGKLNSYSLPWWNMDIESISKFFQDKKLSSFNENHLKNFSICFSAVNLVQGKVADIKFEGLRSNGVFIPKEKIRDKHLNYLNQQPSTSGDILVSDEIFDDLITCFP